MSGDPVFFAWNNQQKPLGRERPERHVSTKPRISVSDALLHVMFPGTQVGSVEASSVSTEV